MFTSTTYPRALTWQYWTLFVQLGISLYYLVTSIIWALFSDFRIFGLVSILVPVVLNVIFMLTLDFARTDTYGGTIVVQLIASVVGLVPNVVFIGLSSLGGWHMFVGLLVPIVISSLCSLYMIISLLMAKRNVAENSWTSNTKDALLGATSSTDRGRLSWLGRRRSPPLRKRDVSMFVYFWVVSLPKVLFRRVSPVESKRFAFFQNLCALLFMIAIIIRTITALTQAQTSFETRIRTDECGSIPYVEDMRVLVRHQGANNFGINPRTGQGYSVSVQATFRTAVSMTTAQCESQSLSAVQDNNWQNNWFEVFTCTPPNSSFTYVTFTDAAYNLTIHSINGTSLSAMQLPSIWLSDSTDTLQEPVGSTNASVMKSVAPWLVPPWQLLAGMHIAANVGLTRRKFITSSVLRDIVVKLEPIYSTASLFPITKVQTARLPDNQTATAILTPLFQSPLSYSNSREFIESNKLQYSWMPTVCAFIEDYRSSTIFDALGSVGGLLAILQSVHIFSFGRPMFWGLTGAKLINPFGMLGRCHSQAFRRRLRERYHYQPTDGNGHSMGDPSDAIRLNAFLRDFVIDFGPADIDDDPEKGQNAMGAGKTTPPEAERDEDDHAGGAYAIPLLPHLKSPVDSEGSYLSMDTIVSKSGSK